LSLVGAGGKTSLLFHLARQLANSGKRVLTTTTTKIFVPTYDQSQNVIIASDPETVLLKATLSLYDNCHITAASTHMVETGKLKGFQTEYINLFEKSGLFDWILVEADGAAGRSLKAPAELEPVIPSCTTVMVVVAGLDVIGEPLSGKLVFRSEIAGTLMGLAGGDTITEAALLLLLAHPLGSFKGTPHLARRFIFLNKGDDPARCATGARIAAQLRMPDHPIAEALIVGQARDGVSVHTLHPLLVPS
jgi:probable selenium-dependent hydroxylase accessory protein YqeC